MAKKKTETTTTEANKEQKAVKAAKITAPITQRELRDLREQYAKLKLDLATGKHDSSADARKLRRNIARAMTFGINNN
jgi:ribosomal protein L29